MVVAGATLARLLVSSATIYLCVGYLADPGGLNLIVPDPLHHADVIGRVAEVALLISLFTVGLRMGVPIFDRRWMVPLRLAFVSMAITVGLIAALGMWGLGLPMGAAVLLGGILAPTDPVLASGVQTERGTDPDQLRFSLAGEGALNDGTAFPFVTLGLAFTSALAAMPGSGWKPWKINESIAWKVVRVSLFDIVARIVARTLLQSDGTGVPDLWMSRSRPRFVKT